MEGSLGMHCPVPAGKLLVSFPGGMASAFFASLHIRVESLTLKVPVCGRPASGALEASYLLLDAYVQWDSLQGVDAGRDIERACVGELAEISRCAQD